MWSSQLLCIKSYWHYWKKIWLPNAGDFKIFTKYLMCICLLHIYIYLPNMKLVEQELCPAGRDMGTQTTAGDCIYWFWQISKNSVTVSEDFKCRSFYLFCFILFFPTSDFPEYQEMYSKIQQLKNTLCHTIPHRESMQSGAIFDHCLQICTVFISLMAFSNLSLLVFVCSAVKSYFDPDSCASTSVDFPPFVFFYSMDFFSIRCFSAI